MTDHTELIAEARRRHIENPLEAAWCEGCDTSFPCDALILADALEVAERERDEANERWAGQIGDCSRHIRTASERFEERHRQLVAYNDELRQAVEQAGRAYTVRGEILTAAIERAEHAERERDEAVADNAALLEALNDAVAEYADATRFDKHGDEAEIARLRGIAEADHPGAVLLARMERLEGVLRSVSGLLNEMHHATQGCTDGACTMRTDFCYVRQAALDALSESEATG